ncbi:hypothetical protein NKR23_g8283 [Pleurostoma richardsiae]|uniref:Zn(2)-C6 fungal-type domain-containing protein n=1 Tax=Pleurostoma richardsiae TaxID=41990 RepID=A0AA38RJG0_9PEZI|nr:hypothetical protein NKR23_g8283 [Pleurostoma richardsiae]
MSRCVACRKSKRACDYCPDTKTQCSECKRKGVDCIDLEGSVLAPRPDILRGSGIRHRCQQCEKDNNSCNWFYDPATSVRGCTQCQSKKTPCTEDGVVVEDLSGAGIQPGQPWAAVCSRNRSGRAWPAEVRPPVPAQPGKRKRRTATAAGADNSDDAGDDDDDDADETQGRSPKRARGQGQPRAHSSPAQGSNPFGVPPPPPPAAQGFLPVAAPQANAFNAPIDAGAPDQDEQVQPRFDPPFEQEPNVDDFYPLDALPPTPDRNDDPAADFEMGEGLPAAAGPDRFDMRGLRAVLDYPVWITHPGLFNDASVTVGSALLQNERQTRGIPGLNQYPAGHPEAIDPNVVADDPGQYRGHRPLASIATEQPEAPEPVDGKCMELVHQDFFPPWEDWYQPCKARTGQCCVDLLHGPNAWLVCRDCDGDSKQIINQRDYPGIQPHEIMAMRAFWCANCAETQHDRDGVFRYSGQRVWGYHEEPGRPSAALHQGDRTGRAGEKVGGFMGEPLTHSGCACMAKLLHNVLCKGHRLTHAEELVNQAAVMQEWRLKLYGRMVCPLCKEKVGVDAWGFQGANGGEGKTKVWACLVCHEVVVFHGGGPGGTGPIEVAARP